MEIYDSLKKTNWLIYQWFFKKHYTVLASFIGPWKNYAVL